MSRTARVGIGLVAGLLVSGFVVVGPGAAPAAACSCVGFTDAQSFDRADAVFVGEVVGYEPPPQKDVMSSGDPATWTFEVSGVYKGEVTSTQEVVSEVDGASCGLEIPQRGEFVVFATSNGFALEPGEGQYYAGLCGGTRSTAAGPLEVEVVMSAPIEVEAPPTSQEAPTTSAEPASGSASGEDGVAAPAGAADEDDSGMSVAVLVGLGAVVAALVVLGAVMARVIRRPG